MTDLNELKSYVDTQDEQTRFALRQEIEDFEHQVSHTLSNYEDYLAGRIGSIHDEVWEGVDATLSDVSTAPVQNKVITEALVGKANAGHTHDDRYYTETEVDNLLNFKVEKINGKGLSTNDYTDEDKELVGQINNLIINSGAITGIRGSAESSYRVGNVTISPANLGLGRVDNTNDLEKPISTAVRAALDNKVTAISGKGLSTNDYTDADKAALANKVDKVTGKGLSTNDFTNVYKNLLDNLDASGVISLTVDDALDDTSENPVQNAVITTALGLKAPLASPVFTGTPKVPNLLQNADGLQIVNKNYVDSSLASIEEIFFIDDNTTYAQINSALNGDKIIVFHTPIYESTSGLTYTTQLRFTQKTADTFYFSAYIPSINKFYLYSISSTNEKVGQFVSTDFNNVALTGIPTAPTPIAGTNNTQIATTAFVQAAITAGAITLDNALNASSENAVKNSVITAALDNKVDKVTGKGLSTNDFTDAYKNAFDAINLTGVLRQGDYITAGQLNPSLLGDYATAEGYETNAQGDYSHAEGENTSATGRASHAEGIGTAIATPGGHAGGTYNLDLTQIVDDGNGNISFAAAYLEIIGNGSLSTGRANARTLDISGNEWLAGKLTVGVGPTNNMDVATKLYVDTCFTNSPALAGTPTAPTAARTTNTTQIATTAFVNTVVNYELGVLEADLTSDFNSSLNLKAAIASPDFTGTPTAPTAAAGTNTTQIATTAFVQQENNCVIISYSSSSMTAEQLWAAVNIAYIANKEVILKTSMNNHTVYTPLAYYGNVSEQQGFYFHYIDDFSAGYITVSEFLVYRYHHWNGSGYTDSFGVSTTRIAKKVPLLDSPAFTGTPTAPTAASGTNTTQIATTAYVQTELSNFSTCPYSRGTTAPTNTQLLWIDTTGGYNILKFYDGTNWTPITPTWTV